MRRSALSLILLILCALALHSQEKEKFWILVVYPRTEDTRVLYERLKQLRQAAGHSEAEMEIRRVGWDRARGREILEKWVGLREEHLPCVCVVQVGADGHPRKVLHANDIIKQIEDVEDAAKTIFARAEKRMGLSSVMSTPTPAPTATATPTPPAARLATRVGVAQSADGLALLALQGTDGQIYHQWQRAAGTALWADRRLLVQGAVRTFDVAYHAGSKRIALFFVGLDGSLYQMWQTSPGQRAWLSPQPFPQGAGAFGIQALSLASDPGGDLILCGLDAGGAAYLWQLQGGKAWAGPVRGPDGSWAELRPTAGPQGQTMLFGLRREGKAVVCWTNTPLDPGSWDRTELRTQTAVAHVGGVMSEGDGLLYLFLADPHGPLRYRVQQKPTDFRDWHEPSPMPYRNLTQLATSTSFVGGVPVLIMLDVQGVIYQTWQHHEDPYVWVDREAI